MNHLRITKHILNIFRLFTLITLMTGCNAGANQVEKLRSFYETIKLADEALLAADALDALAVLGETGGYKEAFEAVQRLKAELEGLDVPDDPEAQALYVSMMNYIDIDLKWLEAGGYSVKMNPHLMSKTNALGEKNVQMNSFREYINVE